MTRYNLLVGGIIMSFRWIKASELENWTDIDSRRAQELLPLLIRKLIIASIPLPSIKDLHFPCGDSIQYTGFDGRTNIDVGNLYTPDGFSIWETGTDENILSKANEDFSKRTRDSLGVEPSNTTFVFVTSRRWKHKTEIMEWISEKKALNYWKDVKLIDANDLETWLELCPGVALWLASKMKIVPPKGIRTLEQFFEDWVNVTDPRINKEFILKGRDELSGKIANWLETGESHLYLSADSKDEALLFFISSLYSVDEKVKETVLNTSLVVENSDTWMEIKENTHDMILVPYFHSFEDIAIPKGCRIVVPFGKNDTAKSNNVEYINRQTREQFSKGLEEMGMDSTKAYDLSDKTGRSLLALRRQLATVPWVKKPKWVEYGNLAELIPALFVGTWNEHKQGDREIISRIAGCDYEAYVKK